MAGLWLNAHEYGARLLRAGEEPWDQPSTLGPFYGELAGLLKPWRLVVPVAPLIVPGLPDTEDGMEMADALDTLVGSTDFSGRFTTGLIALAHSRAASICAPLLPGPSRLVHGLEDEDAADDIVAALGQLLRHIVGMPLSGAILIDEPRSDFRDMLSPLRRIAEHAGKNLRIIESDLIEAEWSSDTSEALTECYCVIPKAAEPEVVLARMMQANSAGGGM